MSAHSQKALPTVEELLEDPATSFWVKRSLALALKRDPVDAATDAAMVASVLSARAEKLLKGHFDATMDSVLPGILARLDAAAQRQ